MFARGLRTTEWGVDRESVSSYFSKDFDPEIKDPWVAEKIDAWVLETRAA